MPAHHNAVPVFQCRAARHEGNDGRKCLELRPCCQRVMVHLGWAFAMHENQVAWAGLHDCCFVHFPYTRGRLPCWLTNASVG